MPPNIAWFLSYLLHTSIVFLEYFRKINYNMDNSLKVLESSMHTCDKKNFDSNKFYKNTDIIFLNICKNSIIC